jgi:hypothetical protein
MLRWIVMAAKLQSFDAGSYGIAAALRVFHVIGSRPRQRNEKPCFSSYSITGA